jgi:very-short-patch-repair endonuclease
MGRKKDETIREIRKCKICGKEFIVKKKHSKEMCSDECRLQWGEKEEVKQKRLDTTKKTVQEKYGVDHVWHLKDVHQKTINNRDLNSVFEKQKNTIREKTLSKLLPKLELNNLKLLSDYTRNKNGNTSLPYEFQCTICNHRFTSTLLGCGIIPRCSKCHPSHRDSKPQLFIQDFLNKNNIKYIQNDRKIINPFELDFYLPDHNLGIEVHGLYFHGENMGKNKSYHFNKSKLSDMVGVKLLQIFEDEIVNQKDIVLSKLSNELHISDMNKIDARKCVVKEVNNVIKKDFLEKNHLQGDCKDTLRYGLFYNDELVSLMTFGKRKINGSKQLTNWELIRFCNKNYYSVRGGFNKLLSYILKNNDIKNFITYADCRWSGLDYTKTVYHKSNLLFDGLTNINYWYFKPSSQIKRLHRFNFRKSKLVSDGFDPNKTEWDIMKERGFDRIWDCGNMKFVYTKK